MKKEVWAFALLLLMLGAALLNVWYLDNKTEELLDLLSKSQEYYQMGYFEPAEEYLDQAIKIWMDSDGYTHIAIRHSEVDSATDAFYDLQSAVQEHENSNAAGAYEKVVAHLTSIARMEHVTLGSIF